MRKIALSCVVVLVAAALSVVFASSASARNLVSKISKAPVAAKIQQATKTAAKPSIVFKVSVKKGNPIPMGFCGPSFSSKADMIAWYATHPSQRAKAEKWVRARAAYYGIQADQSFLAWLYMSNIVMFAAPQGYHIDVNSRCDENGNVESYNGKLDVSGVNLLWFCNPKGPHNASNCRPITKGYCRNWIEKFQHKPSSPTSPAHQPSKPGKGGCNITISNSPGAAASCNGPAKGGNCNGNVSGSHNQGNCNVTVTIKIKIICSGVVFNKSFTGVGKTKKLATKNANVKASKWIKQKSSNCNKPAPPQTKPGPTTQTLVICKRANWGDANTTFPILWGGTASQTSQTLSNPVVNWVGVGACVNVPVSTGGWYRGKELQSECDKKTPPYPDTHWECDTVGMPTYVPAGGSGEIDITNTLVCNNGNSDVTNCTTSPPCTGSGCNQPCPSGTHGTPPNCQPDTCPAGTHGTPPNCQPDTCPAGTTGTPPNCKPNVTYNVTCGGELTENKDRTEIRWFASWSGSDGSSGNFNDVTIDYHQEDTLETFTFNNLVTPDGASHSCTAQQSTGHPFVP